MKAIVNTVKLLDNGAVQHTLELGVCSVFLFLAPNKKSQIMWHSSPKTRESMEHAADMARLLHFAMELAAQDE